MRMRKFVDLHTHSLASDGSLPPADLVRYADAADLAAVALTDHDTFSGLAEARKAARDFPDLDFVSGVELSAQPISGTVHLLGLGVDETAPSLLKVAKFLRRAREQRNPRIVEKLQAMGLDIGMDEVFAVASQGQAGEEMVVGRPHIAVALCRKGLVADVSEAFGKYLAKGAAAYVERERPDAASAISAIRAAGGTAIAAHPSQWRCENSAQVERVLRALIADGLQGVEAYHSDHTPSQTRLYLDLARRFDLLVTGGSDFHGDPKPQVRIGRPRVPVAAVGREFLDKLIG